MKAPIYENIFFFALKLNHVYAVTYFSLHSIYEELMEF